MPMIDALWPEDALTPEADVGRLARCRLEKARITLEAALDAALDAASAGMTSRPSLESPA